LKIEECFNLENRLKNLEQKHQTVDEELAEARDLVAINFDKGKKYVFFAWNNLKSIYFASTFIFPLRFDELNQKHVKCESDLEIAQKRLQLVEREKLELDERVKDLSVKLDMTKQRESLLSDDKNYLKRINTELQQKNSDLDKQSQGKFLIFREIQADN
jgi:hypothetical protein